MKPYFDRYVVFCLVQIMAKLKLGPISYSQMTQIKFFSLELLAI